MAWTTPKSWTTGYKVLASDMNTFLSDNDTALRAGGIAIASQAANEVIFASSSTALSRSTGLTFNDSTDALTVGGYLVTNAVGAAANDYTRLLLDGAFTSGGASTAMIGTYMNGALTGHSADSDALVGTKLNNNIVTAGNCTTVAQLWVSEPQITVGSGTVTTSASLYIESAASEATSDYALLIASGATKLNALESTQVDILAEGDLRLQDASGGQYVGLDAPGTVSTSYTLTLPAAIGSVDQALTINNVDGTLQWATISAAAAGSDTQVQFNDGGTSFGGDAGLTYNKTTDALTVAGDLVVDTDTLFVDASEDRVGIGTDAPDSLLDIYLDDASVLGTVIIEQDGAGDASTRYLLTGLISWSTGIDNSDGDSYKISQSSNLNDSVRLSIDTSGTVHVPGAFSKGSGSFMIDHPLPSMKDTHRLVHSFVESNETLLIHRGTVDLVDGSAQIDLDVATGMSSGTWIALCRDEQVFTSNESAWAAVRGSVTGSVLTIDCEDADCTDTVAWTVFSNRHDAHIMETAWTDENGYAIVEPLKPEPEEPEPDDV